MIESDNSALNTTSVKGRFITLSICLEDFKSFQQSNSFTPSFQTSSYIPFQTVEINLR